MSSVYITNKEGSILKHYKKSGYLILDAFAEGNVIRLIRIKKAKDSYLGFETVSDDYILNAATEEKKKVVVKKRITDRMLTEYYLSMELAKPLEEEPKLNETKNQILTEDTTMHLNREDQNTRQYSAYAFGDIITMSEQLGEAIVAADDNSGVVLDQEGKIVWERGVKTLSHSINGISTPSSGGDKSSLSTCIRMLLAYKNTEVTSDYDRTKESVVDYLERELPVTPLKAQNITLDEVLYFVYKDHPVIAIKENGEAVVIIGYDSTTITISDPQRGNVKMGKKEASKLFTDSDTVYITYME